MLMAALEALASIAMLWNWREMINSGVVTYTYIDRTRVASTASPASRPDLVVRVDLSCILVSQRLKLYDMRGLLSELV